MSVQTLLSPYELAALLGQLPPTDEQAAIISSPLEPMLVIAGAGSGKTTTMADRVVWLVANGLVRREEVLGVTFTRKAAGELASRIRRQLGKLELLARSGAVDLAPGASAGDALEPKVSTYHSYASGIVTDYGLRLGVERDAVVLGPAEAWQLASMVVEAHDGEHGHFSAAKSTLVAAVIDLAGECAEHLADPDLVRQTIDEYVARIEDLPYVAGTAKPATATVTKLLNVLRTRGSVAAMVQAYTAAKRHRNALDYGDLVALAARIADEVPQAADLERRRFKVVLLDEFQDTSHAQLTLFARLFGAGHPVTAVGDPHQSIYGFRGASAGQLFRFPDIFPRSDGERARTAELTIAWRNSARILQAANVMSAALSAAPGTGAKTRISVSALRERPDAPAGEVVLGRYASELEEAEAIAETILERKGDYTKPAGAQAAMTVAVLCRRRAQFPALQSAFEARAIPYEIVGLGGLLATPEIVDLVATLRVLADPGRSDALMRLLTGARWRIGTADLMAFADWSRYLARQRARAARDRVAFDPAALAHEDGDVPGSMTGRPDDGRPVQQDMVDGASLVEALDYLGEEFWPESLSRTLTPTGRTRLLTLRNELRALRGFVGDDLLNLLGEVERTMLLDIELSARPGSGIHHARRNLDAFAEAAADFMQSAERVDLPAFLGWLETAESEEGGLEMGPGETNPDAVQLLTVHASKGLEWDAVFVPGMNQGAFPSGRADRWTTGAKSLPWPLRGDRGDLPAWNIDTEDSKTLLENEKLFAADVAMHSEQEERRLAYVAFTRSRDLLLCSSTVWGSAKSPSAVSPFLAELLPMTSPAHPHARISHWEEDPDDGVANPYTATAERAAWPYDPLNGPEVIGRRGTARRPGRRDAVESSAAAVRACREEFLALAGETADPVGAVLADPRFDGLHPRWGQETAVLLAADRLDSRTLQVELPAHISASTLVALGENPQRVTRTLRRPVPRKPGMEARKGTAFHTWVEEFFGTTGQLDLDEYPGADAFVDEAYGLADLQQTFKASPWAQRLPAELEAPVETQVAGVVVRGRIDAVFHDADGRWDLIDWKTGAVPGPAQLAVRSVQLAVYRLAWARLKGIALDEVRAAFYYVGQDRLVRPYDLADEEQLEAIITGAYASQSGDGQDRRV